jgi:SAM-dependent methyltransferase
VNTLMSTDYRQRIYQSYLRSLPHYWPAMTSLAAYESLRAFYRANYLQWLPPDRKSPVIDIGCGAGHYLYFLQKERFTQIEGVDLSPEMVDQCQRQGLGDVTVSHWRVHLSDHANTYGAIVANDFLEHLTKEEIVEFLDAAMRALRPKGRLIFKVPNAYTIFGSRDRYIDFTHEISFTPQSAVQVLTAVGFDPVRILPVHSPVVGIRSAVRRILWVTVFLPVLRAWSFMSDGERQPAVYSVNLLAIADKP